MDFNKLMNTMRELDGVTQHATNESGGMMPGMPTMVNPEPMESSSPEVPPVSMDVSINAQGLDNIEGIINLFKKVNPDMISQGGEEIPSMDIVAPGIIDAEPEMDAPGIEIGPIDAPGMEIEPIDGPIDGPMDGPFDAEPDTDNDAVVDPAEKDSADAEFDTELGNVTRNAFGPQDDTDDTDAANDALADEPAPEPEEELPTDSDSDNDGDSDDEEKDEAWDNSPQEKTYDIDTMVNRLSGGLNDTGAKTYPKVSQGDNPMQPVEEADSGISPEALQGLEELSMDELMQKAAELIKQSKMTDRKKIALLRNVNKSYSPKNILGLLWNSVLGKEGLHAMGSGWSRRFENKEQKVKSIKEQLWAALNEKKGITNEGLFDEHDMITSIRIGDEDPEVGVEFNVGGSHRAATRFEPEEFAEIEITKVTDIETGQDYSDYVYNNRDVFDALHAEISEKLNDDGADDEDNRRPWQHQRFEDNTEEGIDINNVKADTDDLDSLKKLSGL